MINTQFRSRTNRKAAGLLTKNLLRAGNVSSQTGLFMSRRGGGASYRSPPPVMLQTHTPPSGSGQSTRRHVSDRKHYSFVDEGLTAEPLNGRPAFTLVLTFMIVLLKSVSVSDDPVGRLSPVNTSPAAVSVTQYALSCSAITDSRNRRSRRVSERETGTLTNTATGVEPESEKHGCGSVPGRWEGRACARHVNTLKDDGFDVQSPCIRARCDGGVFCPKPGIDAFPPLPRVMPT